MYLQEYLLIIVTNEVFLKIMTKMPSQCIHGNMDNAFFSWFFSFPLFSILFLAMEKKISWCYPALSGKFSCRYWFLMHLTFVPLKFFFWTIQLYWFTAKLADIQLMTLISLRSLSLFLPPTLYFLSPTEFIVEMNYPIL